jgi:peptidoglycan hydrolase-like protein with peptidoglycan-binding domain
VPQNDDAARRDLADPTPWGRSLRASMDRRRAAALRLRRGRRSRGAGIAVTALLAVGATGAFAQDASPTATGGASAASTTTAAPTATTSTAKSSKKSTTAAAQQALGITADGVTGPKTRKAVRAFQKAHGLTVTGNLNSKTLAALGVTTAHAASTSSSTPSTTPDAGNASSLLEAIALCESGGDPTAVSDDGVYRGKYQFTRSTWKTMGGTGDPAQAPEATQDALAAKLLAAEGTKPWPVCGKAVGATS